MAVSDTPNHWRHLKKSLLDRTLRPWQHPSFVLYFLVAVVLIGAAGIWLEVHKLLFGAVDCASGSALRTALITFFPALAGSACMQIVLAEDEQKSMRAVAICLLTVLTAVALCISPATVRETAAIWIAATCSLIALWTWWIANALQTDFQDGNDAPVGKSDPKSDLQGSLVGFKA